MRRTVRTLAIGLIAVGVTAVATSCGDDSTGPTGKTYVAANLNAAAEGGNPPFTSAGTGTVTFVDLGTEITWSMNLTNMTAVGTPTQTAIPEIPQDPSSSISSYRTAIRVS